MIFMKFKIWVISGVQLGHLTSTVKSLIWKQIAWDLYKSIAFLMLVLGKMLPSQMNLGIFHNLPKTTPKPTNSSLNRNVPTSSTLPPNYSIWAKGSTSQLFFWTLRGSAAPLGLKTLFWEPGRLGNHDFHEIWDFGHFGCSGEPPIPHCEIFNFKVNDMGPI